MRCSLIAVFLLANSLCAQIPAYRQSELPIAGSTPIEEASLADFLVDSSPQATARSSQIPSSWPQPITQQPSTPSQIEHTSGQRVYIPAPATESVIVFDSGAMQPWVGMGPKQTSIFADALFLALRDTDVAFAGVVNNAGTTAGPTETLSSGYSTGFRIGGELALTESESLRVTWWNIDASADATATAPAGRLLSASMTVPPSPTFAAGSLTATGSSTFEMSLIDIMYRRRVTPIQQNFTLNYRIGARIANWDQTAAADYSINGPVAVDSSVNFSGGGLKVVIDAERWVRPHFMSYFDVGFALIGGQFDSEYRQTTPGGVNDAAATVSEERFVPVFEGEFGLGWQSTGGAFRVKGGYHISAWFNSVTSQGWINGLQGGQLTGISDTVILDGLTLRAEFRW